MIVISDTSCINYLILIGEIEILPALYGRVIIPEAVAAELHDSKAPLPVKGWIANPPEWLEIHHVENLIELEPLHRGEREAITLALQLNADAILLDEKLGRAAAKQQGLAVTGTLGILATAARQDLLILSDAFAKLKQTSYRASKELFDSILEQERLKDSPPD